MHRGWPILPPRCWPVIKWKNRRAITAEEHERIVSTECNAERKQYYQMLWELGSAQSDVGGLTAGHIDWPRRVVVYNRIKTGEQAQVRIGARLEKLLRELPAIGPLFPNW